MKYIGLVCLSVFLFAACAGNPPAWWNPNDRYGTAENQPQKPIVKKKTVIQEETIDAVTDTFYEEETIPVLAEEEEPAAGVEEPAGTDGQNGLPKPSVLE